MENKEYTNAADAFHQALKLQPNNSVSHGLCLELGFGFVQIIETISNKQIKRKRIYRYAKFMKIIVVNFTFEIVYINLCFHSRYMSIQAGTCYSDLPDSSNKLSAHEWQHYSHAGKL